MLVVIILGLVLLGAGTAIFFKAFNKTVELREQVDTRTQAQLNKLLDDGSLIAVPITNKDGKRGGSVDFDIAINNELGVEQNFVIYVTYGGRVPNDGTDPFQTRSLSQVANNQGCGTNRDTCGNAWVLMGTTTTPNKITFTLENNARKYVPIRIWIPKKGVTEGQYIFNVDVCKGTSCQNDMSNRYYTRQKLYVKV